MRKIKLSRHLLSPIAIAVTAMVLIACDDLPSSNSDSSVANRIVRFNGICDGSAVVRLNNKTLLVAYDEENTLFEFSSEGGMPLQLYNYGQALPDSVDEVDVEAAVAVDDYVWWIGSHGNDGNGDVARSRQQLFKTRITAQDSIPTRIEVAEKSINLLPALIRKGRSAGFIDSAVLLSKPKKGGINIEGLSVMANGDLLVGLRSPLSNGRLGQALIAQVNLKGSTPEVVKFFQLDLDNRGIRDLHASGDGFLLIAGDVASGGEFAIYRWRPDGVAKQVYVLPGHFNAEALVSLGDRWLVLSDDGKEKRSDEAAADGDRKCDSIRRKNPRRENHPSVFFRALQLDEQTLQ